MMPYHRTAIGPTLNATGDSCGYGMLISPPLRVRRPTRFGELYPPHSRESCSSSTRARIRLTFIDWPFTSSTEYVPPGMGLTRLMASTFASAPRESRMNCEGSRRDSRSLRQCVIVCRSPVSNVRLRNSPSATIAQTVATGTRTISSRLRIGMRRRNAFGNDASRVTAASRSRRASSARKSACSSRSCARMSVVRSRIGTTLTANIELSGPTGNHLADYI